MIWITIILLLFSRWEFKFEKDFYVSEDDLEEGRRRAWKKANK